MENVLNISNLNGVDVIESRIIADELGIEHRALIQGIRKYQDQMESNFGRVAFEMLPLQTSGGVQQFNIAYLTEDQAIFIGTLSKNTESVIKFKAKLVKAFQQKRSIGFRLPQSFAEALQLAADQAKKIEEQSLQIEKQAESISQSMEIIQEMKPKAVAADILLISQDTVNIAQFAKTINTGQNRLFDKLRADKFLIPEGGKKNLPYQKYLEQGLFEVREVTKTADNKIKVFFQTMITPKGQIYLANKYTTK